LIENLAATPQLAIDIETGFMIPNIDPPRFETDGPLGAAFLLRAGLQLGIPINIGGQMAMIEAIAAGLSAVGIDCEILEVETAGFLPSGVLRAIEAPEGDQSTHYLAIEHVGRTANGRYYTMRGRDITEFTNPVDRYFLAPRESRGIVTAAIGDGGNEIGMGTIPPDVIAANIPLGEQIHCIVPADYLVVAGVSNWGAYALAAGLALRFGKPLSEKLFNPNVEKECLQAMVDAGLVDGVRGTATATVDGLDWDLYSSVLPQLRTVLESA
ncbi:MAG: glutamate cyclase domain-containing protein, partial [Gemmataceae bacterium]